jgi:hypothetical protein
MSAEDSIKNIDAQKERMRDAIGDFEKAVNALRRRYGDNIPTEEGVTIKTYVLDRIESHVPTPNTPLIEVDVTTMKNGIFLVRTTALRADGRIQRSQKIMNADQFRDHNEIARDRVELSEDEGSAGLSAAEDVMRDRTLSGRPEDMTIEEAKIIGEEIKDPAVLQQFTDFLRLYVSDE